MLRNSYSPARNRRLTSTVLLLIAATTLEGQSGAPDVLHSITGVVRELGSGQPVPGSKVSTVAAAGIPNGSVVENRGSRKTTATTDKEGRYVLSGLPAGRYSVTIFVNRRFISKQLTVLGTESSASLDFDVPAAAVIAGRVEDARGEPLAGALVSLFSKEYQSGVLRLVAKDRVTTNDAGDYEFHSVQPDHAWFIVAEKEDRLKLAVSPVPRDVKARQPALVPTWFPGSPEASGAAPVLIKEARRIEAIDIRMVQSPNLCAEGILESGGRPSALEFYIDEGGVSSSMHVVGHTAPDGRFRVCGLYPGVYQLSAAHFSGFQHVEPPSFGTVPVVIGKTDLSGIRLAAQQGVRVEGKAVFDAATPENTPSAAASIYLEPLSRYSFVGEKPDQSFSVPGEFSFAGLLLDDYVVHVHCNGDGLYVKDVTYAGSSVLREPLRSSRISPSGAFRVVCGTDAASVGVLVADKDGKGVPDISVLAVPADADTQSQLAGALVTSQTDQDGQCALTGLAPGKYHVLATSSKVEMTPEALTSIAQALQSKATEVELGARQHSAVTLTGTSLN